MCTNNRWGCMLQQKKGENMEIKDIIVRKCVIEAIDHALAGKALRREDAKGVALEAASLALDKIENPLPWEWEEIDNYVYYHLGDPDEEYVMIFQKEESDFVRFLIVDQEEYEEYFS